jgi:hypothetical protein
MDGCSEACVSGESDPSRGKGHPIGRDRTVSISTRCVVCGVMSFVLFYFVVLWDFHSLPCTFATFIISHDIILLPIISEITTLHPIASHLFLSHPIFSHPILSYLSLSRHTPSYFASHHIASHYITHPSPRLSSPPIEYEIDQAEAGSITPVWPALQGSLYESQFLSQLFMVPHPHSHSTSHSHSHSHSTSHSHSHSISFNSFYLLIHVYVVCG